MNEKDDFGGCIDCNIPETAELTELEQARRTASFAFVGRYMQSFALLENNISDAIQGILGIDIVERIILVDPIPFNGKLNILECFCEWHGRVDEAWYRKTKDVIRRMRNASNDRNLVAHSVFFPLENEAGLMIYRSSAKNKVNYGDERWSLRDGEDKIYRIETLCVDLKELVNKLQGLRLSLRQAVTENPGTFSGGLGTYGGGLLGNLAEE